MERGRGGVGCRTEFGYLDDAGVPSVDCKSHPAWQGLGVGCYIEENRGGAAGLGGGIAGGSCPGGGGGVGGWPWAADGLEDGAALADVALKGGAAGEVPRPERVGPRGGGAGRKRSKHDEPKKLIR